MSWQISSQLLMQCFRLFLVISIVLASVFSGGWSPTAKAAGFDAGTIVSDTFFTAVNSMGVADIQSFLVSKGSVLANLDPSVLGDDAAGRSAAQIIYDASRINRTDFAHSDGYGVGTPLVMNLNPEVLLVTLQKENSLITGSYVAGSPATAAALQSAMGYGCPDSGGCNAAYAGFADQVTYAGAQFMRNYYKASGSAYAPGQTYTIANTVPSPYNPPASQSVTIGNASTSSLYQYTPHVYNGNYNFWYYVNAWFSGPINTFSPVARVVKSNLDPAVYLANANLTQRWYLPSLSYAAAWGVTASLEVLPDAEVQAMPAASGTISRLAKSYTSPSVYFVENGHKHHISDEREFPLYGLSWSELGVVDDSLLSQIPEGPPIGLLSKSSTQAQVYFMTFSHKYYIPDEATLKNWGFTWNDVTVLPQAVIDSLPTAGSLTTVAQFENNPNVYVVSGGQLLYVPSEALLNQWGLNFGMLVNIGKERQLVMPTGPNLTQVVRGSGPSVYFVQNGKKRYVSSWSRLTAAGQSQNSLITVSDSLLAQLPTGPNL